MPGKRDWITGAIVFFLTGAVTASPIRAQQEKVGIGDKTLLAHDSLVPRRESYAVTLREQLEQLKTDSQVLRFAASRKRLAADPYRPVYHYVNPEGTLNYPNGLCFWQERYHLFYQAYPSEDPRQH